MPLKLPNSKETKEKFEALKELYTTIAVIVIVLGYFWASAIVKTHEKYPDYKGRTVIIIDDGIATGATTLSAIKEVRSWGAGKIVLAVPVSSKEAAENLGAEVDEFITLSIPPFMRSVGQFYQSFPQVSDHEVERLLKESKEESDLELF
jgi:predicted phosphoribosyltransferase